MTTGAVPLLTIEVMKLHRSILFLILVLLTSVIYAEEPLAVTKDSVSTFYRKFQRLTKKPHYVSPGIAFSCAGPTKEELQKETARTGPHFDTMVHLYVNPAAADSITAKEAEFPAGSVIVKEKIDFNKKITGIGGMIKRAKGYDPANGDWEFFYYMPGGEFFTGKLANCIDCHNSGTRDHVFSVWDLPKKFWDQVE
jgi:hypothetical protein